MAGVEGVIAVLISLFHPIMTQKVIAGSLSLLSDGHALLHAEVFDFLNYLELVAQWNAHLLDMLILHFQDGFHVFDAAAHELIIVLFQFDINEEFAYLLTAAVFGGVAEDELVLGRDGGERGGLSGVLRSGKFRRHCA